MNDRRAPLSRAPRDKGFTLIEVLIVISMIGFLSATLAAVFTVVVRSTPDADERVNDARSLKGLVTWIPQDMDATPPGGFDDSPVAWPCASAAPPAPSFNVIAMSWAEVGDVTTEFHASYRYELRGGEWVIARYSCQDAGTARRVNMTSALPAWSWSSPPAWVAMCSAPINAATGACPPGGEVSDPATEPVESMKVTVTLIDGRTYTIDAAAKNPDENLADDPEAVTNYPPVALNPNLSVDMRAGETRVLDLYTTHLVSDPEGDFLTSAVDSYEPMPSGISVISSDPLKVTIAADPSVTGPLPHPVSLIVSDAYGGSTNATITINILPNDPPVASSSPYTLTISAGESIILPLDLSHGVSDPNGDPLTLEVQGSSWPAPLANRPEVGAPLGELQMKVTVKPDAAVGLVSEPIRTLVKDNRGGSVTVETFLNIVAPAATTNNPPTVTAFADPASSMEAGDSITLTVDAMDPDGDLIWAVPGVPVPAGLTVTTSGLAVTVTADGSIMPGTYVVPLLVYDWRGAFTSISAKIEIVPPPPPPPSSCVLGSLSAVPNPVGRHGGGSQARVLDQNVLVTLTYTGSCDGLVLKYDTGHDSGLGSGVGRVFPSGSPTTVELRGKFGGGSEKWSQGPHELTASTTSAVSPNSVSITLTVN